MMQYIFWAVVFYLLFRFIFNFVIPVVRAGKQMKRQMNEFQSRMHQQQQSQQFENGSQKFSPDRDTETRSRKGDYIDFEEVK